MFYSVSLASNPVPDKLILSHYYSLSLTREIFWSFYWKRFRKRKLKENLKILVTWVRCKTAGSTFQDRGRIKGDRKNRVQITE